jgi:hypothetical protein
MCSLRFENIFLSSEGVRFSSISKKTQLSKLSFAFVSLALPLLIGRDLCLQPEKLQRNLQNPEVLPAHAAAVAAGGYADPAAADTPPLIIEKQFKNKKSQMFFFL